MERGCPITGSREGSAFLTGMILDQLYAEREKTLSGLEARLCDPGQPIDDTMQQIMRAEHDPSGSLGWTDSRGIPTRTHPIIARAMRSMLDKSPNERSGVISEVKGFLELYRDPVIAANTASSDFRITDLMNHQRPLSLYIVVPLAHKNSLKPVIRLMLGQILHRLTENLEFRNGRAVTGYRHRLLLMIDEFPSLGRLDVFAESLSLVAGYGIKGCLIAQDLSQIHAAYGHDEAITSNCHTRVAFAPNRIETARLLSHMTGATTVRHAHRTVSSSGASVSEPEVARPLITPDEAMRLGANEGVDFHQWGASDSSDEASLLLRSIFQTACTDSSATKERSHRIRTACCRRYGATEGRRGESHTDTGDAGPGCRTETPPPQTSSCGTALVSKIRRRERRRRVRQLERARRQGETTVRRQLTAYLSEEEFHRLRDEADERGITLSRYVKERLFSRRAPG
jgi:Type IV secretory system Conjugative DNA transfer